MTERSRGRVARRGGPGVHGYRSAPCWDPLQRLESRMLRDAVFWYGGAATSNWRDAANWNRNGANALPLDGDDVTIDVPTSPTIMYTTGTVSLHSLVSNEAITVTAGTLGLMSQG